MALSNKFGHMLMTTGNKSEMSVGYATIYGDMAGGYNPIKDAYKLTVFAISRWRNQHGPKIGLGPKGPVIPENIIVKPPSAELRPDQKDTDSLPPYDVLDAVLEDYVEDSHSAEQIARDRGIDMETVRRVMRMVDRAEYKRQQAAPGLKISPKAFGYGRRFPIAAKGEV